MNSRREEIQAFLDSGILEQYYFGLTNADEAKAVEDMIASSDLVREEWEVLQSNLESLAMTGAVEVPSGLKESIMKELTSSEEVKNGPSLTVASSKKPEAKPQLATIKRMNRMVVAASIAALVFATVAMSQWNKAATYKAQVADLTRQVNTLEESVSGQQRIMASLESDFNLMADPATQKIHLLGGDNAPDFNVVAYWNKQEQKSYLKVENLPELPNEGCFQLWADVHGEMVNLGVIEKNEDGLIALDYKVDAESLNVTIEPKGGSEHPTVSRLVSSRVLKT